MSAPLLNFIEAGAKQANKCVIWLHGLGANGHDFEPVIPELQLPVEHNIRFIFPHAPEIPVTINSGVIMPAWYDLFSLSFTEHEDEDGINRSARQITQLIEHENQRGIPCHQIILAGFSQGGAIALHTALRHPEPLAGVMALSAYLPLHKSFSQQQHRCNLSVPILMCHGTHDPVVPYTLGQKSCQCLEQNGYTVDWHSYPMQHSLCNDEIQTIRSWLGKILL